MMITLTVKDSSGNILKTDSGENLAAIVYEAEYQQGDTITLETSETGVNIGWQVDDALGEAICYITGPVTYQIPFGEKRTIFSPKVFSGSRHYMYAKAILPDEVSSYRNLAANKVDQHEIKNCYPHASANVETRGESVFAAKNAIDTVLENRSHGEWPYTSWGINRDPNAQIKLDFGRTIQTDCIKIVLRADFPHDAWWTQGLVTFSDGSTETLSFVKTKDKQTFPIKARNIEWLTLDHLCKADDPSPFPALTQIEVYGRELDQ